jgi:hypothetical protein
MLCISITTRPSPPPHPPHRLTASPLPGRPSRGSTTTRQQRWKSTRPPAPSMRARSRARCGLWSSVRRSGPPSRHSTARLSPGGGGGRWRVEGVVVAFSQDAGSGGSEAALSAAGCV